MYDTSATYHSEGQRRLAAQLLSLREIGDIVGVSRMTVCRWVHGHALPSPSARRALELEFRIPAEAWFQRAKPGRK